MPMLDQCCFVNKSVYFEKKFIISRKNVYQLESFASLHRVLKSNIGKKLIWQAKKSVTRAWFSLWNKKGFSYMNCTYPCLGVALLRDLAQFSEEIIAKFFHQPTRQEGEFVGAGSHRIGKRRPSCCSTQTMKKILCSVWAAVRTNSCRSG